MKALILFIGLTCLVACDSSDDPGFEDNVKTITTGTLRVAFRISHPWIPANRIIISELHVAKDAESIYKGKFLQSANPTSFQTIYTFNLEPGTYYYEAVIACICEGDSCSGGGFPGNKFGTKHTMDRFQIYLDQVTEIVPFCQ